MFRPQQWRISSLGGHRPYVMCEMDARRCQEAGLGVTMTASIAPPTASSLPLELLRDGLIRTAPNEAMDIPTVDRIPPEVFVPIFHCILDNSQPTKRSRVLVSLSQVSTRWYAMTANTPSLWSVINVWDHPMIRSMALDRSKTWPLTILCYHTTVLVDRRVPSSKARSLFTALMPHIDRWKHIYIGEVQSMADIKGFLELPAPMIETFEIGRGSYGITQHKIDLFAGQAPRLQRVFIMGTGIKWDSGVLRGLRFLTLSYLGQHPTPSQILQMLSICSRLETFELSNTSRVYFPHEIFEAAQIHATSPIILPHLQKFKIINVLFELLCFIARNIRAPNCSDIILGAPRRYHPTGPGDNGIFQTLRGALTPFMPTIQSHLSERREFRFSVAGIVLSGGIEAKRQQAIRAKFDEVGNYLPALYQWLYDNCQPFQSASLELTHGSYASYDTAYLAAERLPFVTRLRIELEYETEELLAFLAAPVVRDGVARWPFPSIRWLEIATNGERISVLPMVERRYVVGKQLAVEGNVVVNSIERPARLEHLRVDNVSKQEYSALARILGVGGLQVDVEPESNEE